MHPKHWGSMSTWRRCSHPPSNFLYDRALSLILKQWMMTFDGHIWASPKRSCTLDQKSFVGHLWSDIIWEDSLQSKTTHVYQEIICRWRISRQHILSFAAKHSHFETSNSHMTVRSSHLTVLLLHMTVGNVIGHPPRCSWSTMTWHINITPYVNECEWCKWRHNMITACVRSWFPQARFNVRTKYAGGFCSFCRSALCLGNYWTSCDKTSQNINHIVAQPSSKEHKMECLANTFSLAKQQDFSCVVAVRLPQEVKGLKCDSLCQ